MLGDALKRTESGGRHAAVFDSAASFSLLPTLHSVIMISRSLLLSSSVILRRSTSRAGHRSVHFLQSIPVPRPQSAFSFRTYATKSEADVKIEEITELSAFFPNVFIPSVANKPQLRHSQR